MSDFLKKLSQTIDSVSKISQSEEFKNVKKFIVEQKDALTEKSEQYLDKAKSASENLKNNNDNEDTQEMLRRLINSKATNKVADIKENAQTCSNKKTDCFNCSTEKDSKHTECENKEDEQQKSSIEEFFSNFSQSQMVNIISNMLNKNDKETQNNLNLLKNQELQSILVAVVSFLLKQGKYKFILGVLGVTVFYQMLKHFKNKEQESKEADNDTQQSEEETEEDLVSQESEKTNQILDGIIIAIEKNTKPLVTPLVMKQNSLKNEKDNKPTPSPFVTPQEMRDFIQQFGNQPKDNGQVISLRKEKSFSEQNESKVKVKKKKKNRNKHHHKED